MKIARRFIQQTLFILGIVVCSCDDNEDESQSSIVGTWVCVKIQCNNGSVLTYSVKEERAKLIFYEDGTYYPYETSNHNRSFKWKYETGVLTLIVDEEKYQYSVLTLNPSTLIFQTEGTINTYSKVK